MKKRQKVPAMSATYPWYWPQGSSISCFDPALKASRVSATSIGFFSEFDITYGMCVSQFFDSGPIVKWKILALCGRILFWDRLPKKRFGLVQSCLNLFWSGKFKIHVWTRFSTRFHTLPARTWYKVSKNAASTNVNFQWVCLRKFLPCCVTRLGQAPLQVSKLVIRKRFVWHLRGSPDQIRVIVLPVASNHHAAATTRQNLLLMPGPMNELRTETIYVAGLFGYSSVLKLCML